MTFLVEHIFAIFFLPNIFLMDVSNEWFE